jgi:hypothetical protein
VKIFIKTNRFFYKNQKALVDILSVACLKVFAIVRKETDRIYFLHVCDKEKIAKIDVCAHI